MKTTYEVTLLDPKDNEHVVLIEEDGPVKDFKHQQDALVQIILKAARNHASTLVNYDAFQSDSAYLEALDQAQEALRFLSIAAGDPAAPLRRYAVEYAYLDDGSWLDSVEASSEANADIAARMCMAENSAVELPHCKTEDLASFVDTLFEFEQIQLYHEPMSFPDFRKLVTDALGETADAGPAMLKLREAVAAFNTPAAA